MKVFRADAVGALAGKAPAGDAGLGVEWLEGPVNADRLDVGLVTVAPGGETPPHVHLGGQVIVVLSGDGFVATASERLSIGAGDVVISPPGELHTHGAGPTSALSHLTVTTGGYDFPEPPGSSS